MTKGDCPIAEHCRRSGLKVCRFIQLCNKKQKDECEFNPNSKIFKLQSSRNRGESR